LLADGVTVILLLSRRNGGHGGRLCSRQYEKKAMW
jgi:hypothetical protein